MMMMSSHVVDDNKKKKKRAFDAAEEERRDEADSRDTLKGKRIRPAPLSEEEVEDEGWDWTVDVTNADMAAAIVFHDKVVEQGMSAEEREDALADVEVVRVLLLLGFQRKRDARAFLKRSEAYNDNEACLVNLGDVKERAEAGDADAQRSLENLGTLLVKARSKFGEALADVVDKRTLLTNKHRSNAPFTLATVVYMPADDSDVAGLADAPTVSNWLEDGSEVTDGADGFQGLDVEGASDSAVSQVFLTCGGKRSIDLARALRPVIRKRRQ